MPTMSYMCRRKCAFLTTNDIFLEQQRKREANFKAMLKAASPPLQASDKWDEVRREGERERERERGKEGGREREFMFLLRRICIQVRSRFQDDQVYGTITEESERMRIFKEYIKGVKVKQIHTVDRDIFASKVFRL